MTATTTKTNLEQLAAALERIKAEYPEQTDELNVGIKALRRIWKRLDGEQHPVIKQAQEVVDAAIATVEKSQVSEVKAPEKEEKTDDPKALGNDHPSHIVPNGYFTVVHPDKTHTTLRFRPHWEEAEAIKGVQVVHLLTGPDNEQSYTGVAFVRGNQVFMWKKYKEATKVRNAVQFLLNGGSLEAGEMYAMQSGKCWKCGKTLTVPASLHRGVGPVCAEKLGLI